MPCSKNIDLFVPRRRTKPKPNHTQQGEEARDIFFTSKTFPGPIYTVSPLEYAENLAETYLDVKPP